MFTTGSRSRSSLPFPVNPNPTANFARFSTLRNSFQPGGLRLHHAPKPRQVRFFAEFDYRLHRFRALACGQRALD
jgi:hypothetical protein